MWNGQRATGRENSDSVGYNGVETVQGVPRGPCKVEYNRLLFVSPWRGTFAEVRTTKNGTGHQRKRIILSLRTQVEESRARSRD